MIAPRKTFAEFFAGIGLMRMGLEKAGWSVLFANDIDPMKARMYRRHYGECPEFVPGDIHRLAAAEIPSVDLATASFPCNDLSLAGSRSGLAGAHSSAFWGFARILSAMGSRKPRSVLIENVPGFLSSHGGGDLRAALTALSELGYSMDLFTIDAAHFVPQSRRRLFITGQLDNRSRVLNARDLEVSDVRPAAICRFINATPEIRWAIRPLPELPVPAGKLSNILEEVPCDSPLWWDTGRRDYLLNQMSAKHRALADAMIAAPVPSYGTIFRRVRKGRSMAELRVDGCAGCLRTPRGGSGRQILFSAGVGAYRARLLTPLECARLMGAGEFTISGSSNEALFGFGDAVCVPVIEWIARHCFTSGNAYG